jgi:curved DNA-binding protein CbpA
VSRPSFGELQGQDPYDILELPSGASDAEVRAARKRLMRKYHPDLPTGDLHRTQMITAAADLLLDPFRRTGYYGLRDEQARRTKVPDPGSADRWFTGSTAGRVDDPPPTPVRPRNVEAPTSGTRSESHWFRPLADADGHGHRPSPFRGRAAAPGGNGIPRQRYGDDAGPGSPTAAATASGGDTATEPTKPIRPTFITPPNRAGKPADRPTRPVDPTTAAGSPTVGGRTGGVGAVRSAANGAGSVRSTANGAGSARPTRSETRHKPAADQMRPAAGDPVTASRWNALAVASVVAILTWTPIPLVLGLLAFRQIYRFDQRGMRLALTGIVVGAVFTLIYVYLLVWLSF